MPSEPSFTAQGLCAIFGIDRKVFEAAIGEQLVPAAPVRRGAVRWFNFWEALDIGIFGDLLNQGVARRHAARIGFAYDFSGTDDITPDGRDLWLIARPKGHQGEGSEDQHPGFAINTCWVEREPEWLRLPAVEPQRPDEQKAGRKTYIRRTAVIVNVSAIARELRSNAAVIGQLGARARRRSKKSGTKARVGREQHDAT